MAISSSTTNIASHFFLRLILLLGSRNRNWSRLAFKLCKCRFCIRTTFTSGLRNKLNSSLLIFYNTITITVTDSKEIFGIWISVFFSFLNPFDCFIKILSSANGVHIAPA